METRPVPRAPEPKKTSAGLSKGVLIIGLVIFIGAMFVIPRLFSADDDESGAASIRGAEDVPSDAIPENVLGVTIGDLVVTSGIDQNGCAIDRANSFTTRDTIFIVAERSDVSAGSTLFVRLYANGQAVEDSQELTANADYTDTCVNFLFEPVEGAAFDAGDYEAELFVNGNPYGTVKFTVG